MSFRNVVLALRGFSGVATLFLLQGCATLVRGNVEPVFVRSEPSGARVVIDSIPRGATPLVVSLKRNARHNVEVDAAGYVSQMLRTQADTDYLPLAGNLLLFHPAAVVVGIGVDLVTGSHRRVTPGVLSFRLAPVDAAARPASARLWQPAPIGSQLRVSQDGRAATPATGKLHAILGDTLVIQSRSNMLEYVERRSIQRMELGVGADRPRSLLRWAGRGAFVGLATGAAIGYATHGAEGAYYGALLFGVPAGVVGGLVAGAVAPPKERWVVIQ